MPDTPNIATMRNALDELISDIESGVLAWHDVGERACKLLPQWRAVRELVATIKDSLIVRTAEDSSAVAAPAALGNDEERTAAVLNAPPRIYLNVGELLRDTAFSDLQRSGEVSWCDDQIDASDVAYVRADLAAPAAQGEAQTPFGWAVLDKKGCTERVISRVHYEFAHIEPLIRREPDPKELLAYLDREYKGAAPHRLVTLYTTPQPSAGGEIAAWHAEDGRVVSAASMQSLLNDQGAAGKSAAKAYTTPSYFPAQMAARGGKVVAESNFPDTNSWTRQQFMAGAHPSADDAPNLSANNIAIAVEACRELAAHYDSAEAQLPGATNGKLKSSVLRATAAELHLLRHDVCAAPPADARDAGNYNEGSVTVPVKELRELLDGNLAAAEEALPYAGGSIDFIESRGGEESDDPADRIAYHLHYTLFAAVKLRALLPEIPADRAMGGG